MTSASVAGNVEDEVRWAGETLECGGIVVSSSWASQALAVQEEWSCDWATFALLGVGVVDLSRTAGSASSVDDVLAGDLADTSLGVDVVDEGVGAGVARFGVAVPEGAVCADDAFCSIIIRQI